MNDLRYALRKLLKSPGFTAVAVLTLALGIGANTAIFSMADAVLLRSPGVVEPHRLAAIYTTCRRGDPRCSSSYPDYLDYRDRSRTVSDIAAYTWATANLADGGASQLVTVQMTTGNYFNLLGVRPHSGRLLLPGDDLRGAARRVVVLSHSLWIDAFGGDPEIVDGVVRLNGATFQVVGVAPRDFRGLHLDEPDVYIPLLSGPALGTGFVEDDSRFDSRGSRWIAQLVGRLEDGATVEAARAEMLAISAQLAEEYPDARGPRSITVDPVDGHILPAGGRAELVRFLALLVGVVGFTLLLACANIANLLLTRATARQREIGIRLAIGAGRWRVVRQLLSESVLLAVVGGAAGLLVSIWMLDLLSGFQLPGLVAIDDLGLHLDVRMLAIAGATALLTGVAFGLLPALQTTRPDLVTALKDEVVQGRTVGHGMRRALVAVQVALCFVLLVGAGLFLRTLRASLEFDPGFDAESVALARFDLSLLQYGEAEAEGFVGRLTERVRGLPGVEATGLGTLVPLQLGGYRGTFIEVEGYEPGPDEEMRIDYVFVGPDYFRALGIPVLQGRPILTSDDQGGPPVVVINREMADRWWPDGRAVGGRIRFAGRSIEVVGVVENPKWRGLQEEATPFVYAPLAQFSSQMADGPLTLVAATASRDPGRLLPELRAVFEALDPDLSLMELATLRDQLERVLMPQRMGALLLSLFGVLALILSALGIYGVVSYSVARQTRSIGIRIALGARRKEVLRVVAVGMAPPLALGMVVGLVAAAALARTVEGFMFGVSPWDPATFAALAVILGLVGVVATLMPAHRAARIEPTKALRHE